VKNENKNNTAGGLVILWRNNKIIQKRQGKKSLKHIAKYLRQYYRPKFPGVRISVKRQR
jgi:hypothetical protein